MQQKTRKPKRSRATDTANTKVTATSAPSFLQKSSLTTERQSCKPLAHSLNRRPRLLASSELITASNQCANTGEGHHTEVENGLFFDPQNGTPRNTKKTSCLPSARLPDIILNPVPSTAQSNMPMHIIQLAATITCILAPLANAAQQPNIAAVMLNFAACTK